MNTFEIDKCAVFFKTKEKFGGLSNMCAGFPIKVNGVEIRTTEALYQACRFPHNFDLQREIIAEKSPMSAKFRSRANHEKTRWDFDDIKVEVMRFCLKLKLIHNWQTFSSVLDSTGDLPIVEKSTKDPFWGAQKLTETTLFGQNILGKMLTVLRDQMRGMDLREEVFMEVPGINNFTLFGSEIRSQTLVNGVIS